MVKVPKWKTFLRNIYYNVGHPAAFSSFNKLNRIVKNERNYKIEPTNIKQFLDEQDVYSLTKQTRKFKHLKTVFTHKNYLLDDDCGYMPKEYAGQNKGFYMFLLVCDCLSKFVMCRLIKTASGSVVSKELSYILDFYSQNSPIINIRTDLRSEFKSKITQNMLKSQNINHYFSESQHKANFAESAIKHLKRLIFSYMKSRHTQKWVDQFQKIMETQNKTFSRSLNTNHLNGCNNMPNVELWKFQIMTKAKNEK